MFDLGASLILGILMMFFILSFFPYLFYTIYHRYKFFTVNIFETGNLTLPSVLKKLDNENTIQYARNFTYKNQFFLTNLRFVFHVQSILMGKAFTKYFNISSVKNTEITYKNPYGWLVCAAINLIVSIFYSISESSGSAFSNSRFNTGKFILLFSSAVIQTGLFVLLWYYLKGFYLILDNGRITGLFCRSSEGLESIVRKFDLLRLSKEISYSNEILNREESKSKDIVCSKCKSVITLEGDDLQKNSFHCPVCGNVNPVQV